jgi:two-component system, sensor histidine kinase ChiS
MKPIMDSEYSHKKTRHTQLKYQIMGYILMLVLPVLSLLALTNYLDTRDALIESYELLQEQTEDNIANALKLVDSAYKMFEHPLDLRLKQAFTPFVKAYEQAQGQVSEINLVGLKHELEADTGLEMDLYIINDHGVVEYTTYKTDLNLDFRQKFPDYYQKLDSIRKRGSFFADRITAEALTGELRKFVYMPTPDKRYLLELGVRVKNFPNFLDELDPSKIAERLKKFNPMLLEIRLFNRSGLYVLGSPNHKIDQETKDIISKFENNNNNFYQISDPKNKRLVRYILVNLHSQSNGVVIHRDLSKEILPTLSEEFAEDMHMDSSFTSLKPLSISSEVVELTYNTTKIEEILLHQIMSNIAVGIIAIILTVILAFFVSARISQPILQVIRAASLLAGGQWHQNLPVHRSDELGKLALAFNSMAQQLEDSFATLEAKNADLKRLDKLKDEFLTNTSHELRTPLNGIIGIAESLLDGATGQLPERTRYNLTMIISSGRRLANLVNDILDFSKLRHRDLNLNIRPVDMHAVAELVQALTQPLILQKDLTLRNEISPDFPKAAADENRVQQILYNLVGNAIKFTDRGQITVEAEVKVPPLLPENHAENTLSGQRHLIIRVRDTGIGIPANRLDHIFESFEQADGSSARRYGGTGLGLAVTKQLVELHGGHIFVESVEGEGSCFTFTLPVAHNLSELPEDQLRALSHEAMINSLRSIEETRQAIELPVLLPIDDSENDGERRFRILVVDDEPINHQVLVNNLVLKKYMIMQASSGLEALQLLEQGLQPDLILLDIMMPRMTGYEVTQRIRENWSVNELPILLLTAKNQISDLVIGLEAGANDYITKPISKEELLARIKTHLSLKYISDENRRLTLMADEARHAAESASRAKSAFLANMSHELRTPLNAILGYAGLLYEQAEDHAYEDLLPELDKIQIAGKNLLAIISDVLDITRIEAERLDLHIREFKVRDLIDEIVTIIRPQLEGNRLDVRYGSAVNTMCSDPKKIQQILQNLLSNAAKFTHNGLIILSIERMDTLISFRVVDNGIGIPAEHLEAIFEPFNQVDNSSTRIYGGTGLGLTICRQLCLLLGGRILVESEVNKGSIFTIQIPAFLDKNATRENYKE